MPKRSRSTKIHGRLASSPAERSALVVAHASRRARKGALVERRPSTGAACRTRLRGSTHVLASEKGVGDQITFGTGTGRRRNLALSLAAGREIERGSYGGSNRICSGRATADGMT
ncbi:hypothetical protein GUJ93_ZPchr0006g41602 [Zizania palustris]|uniref:Uncharacterized protein n=1 Tax=Zizania palustris TaxID=103762 RepID=A0A8J5TA85_ZIZPA|nr:hypothetical protein GUJ93_ZPchr0006g41602 [Zizania palustris]